MAWKGARRFERTCVSAWRDADGRIAETVPFVAPVPQHLTDEEVLAAIRDIPEAYQEVILLSDVEELTYKEIAAALRIPLGTVMSRLHRGRALLRQPKTYVTQEATKLCAELFALGGGRNYRRSNRIARTLPDSFAGTALRPPLALALDMLVKISASAAPRSSAGA